MVEKGWNRVWESDEISRFDDKTGSKPYIDCIYSDVNVESLDWDFIPTPSRRFFKNFKDFSWFFMLFQYFNVRVANSSEG